MRMHSSHLLVAISLTLLLTISTMFAAQQLESYCFKRINFQQSSENLRNSHGAERIGLTSAMENIGRQELGRSRYDYFVNNVTSRTTVHSGREIHFAVPEQQPGQKPTCEYEILWDGRNDAGQPVASGIYIYRLKAGNFVQSRKMLLVR